MRRFVRWNFPLRPPVYYPPAAAPEPEVIEEVGDDGVPARFSTRRHYWRGVVWLLVALGIQFVASLVPDVVERVYSNGIYYYLSRILAIPGKLVGALAIGEILFLLLMAYFFIWTIWYLGRSWRRQARLFHVLKLFFLHVLWVISVLFPIFLFVWGLNYQRQPLSETLNLERRPAARTGELEAIGLQIITAINTNYERAREGQDWTGASKLPMGAAKLYQTIENAFQAETLLGTASQGGYSDPKPLRLSGLTSLLGVSGFYLAYTAEVTYNGQIPAIDLPMTIAHHKAHQRGYAREDEANFVAFLVCVKSTEPYVRYSGLMYGLKVIDPLAKGEKDKYDGLISRLGPGPIADMRDRAAFWGTSKNTYLGPLSRRMFDIYLRANRVHTGIKNYDEDIYLLISYFLKNMNPQMQAEAPPAGATPTPAPNPTEP